MAAARAPRREHAAQHGVAKGSSASLTRPIRAIASRTGRSSDARRRAQGAHAHEHAGHRQVAPADLPRRGASAFRRGGHLCRVRAAPVPGRQHVVDGHRPPSTSRASWRDWASRTPSGAPQLAVLLEEAVGGGRRAEDARAPGRRRSSAAGRRRAEVDGEVDGGRRGRPREARERRGQPRVGEHRQQRRVERRRARRSAASRRWSTPSAPANERRADRRAHLEALVDRRRSATGGRRSTSAGAGIAGGGAA